MTQDNDPQENTIMVYTPYITRKGKRIYHPSGGLYAFPVPASKYRG